MPPRIARLAGLGAFGAIAGMLAVYALVAFLSRRTPLGGMSSGLAWVTWISLGVVIVAMIAAHVALGKQLLAIGRGDTATEI